MDTRPDHASGVTLTDGVFSQIAFTSPPDPAVALLEPYTQAIFRFSARALELQNQIQPAAGKDNPLPANATLTAMAFSPNKSCLSLWAGSFILQSIFPNPDKPEKRTLNHEGHEGAQPPNGGKRKTLKALP